MLLIELYFRFISFFHTYFYVSSSKKILYVCDLARKNPKILRKKSLMYFWNLLTVATFYALPVVQLVLSSQRVSIEVSV